MPPFSNFTEIRPVGAVLILADRETDTQTDFTKVAGPCRDYANVSKTYITQTILKFGFKNWPFYTHLSYVMYPADVRIKSYSRNCSALLKTCYTVKPRFTNLIRFRKSFVNRNYFPHRN